MLQGTFVSVAEKLSDTVVVRCTSHGPGTDGVSNALHQCNGEHLQVVAVQYTFGNLALLSRMTCEFLQEALRVAVDLTCRVHHKRYELDAAVLAHLSILVALELGPVASMYVTELGVLVVRERQCELSFLCTCERARV